MNPAREINGVIVAYPYLLRPDAKQAHPEVSPLPGTWERCSIDQLVALECVDVQMVARPALRPGDSVSEGEPEFAAGIWRQTWIVIPAGAPSAPPAVESHKCRIELIVRGEWQRVLAIVAAMPEPHRAIATEALGAPYYNRNSPMLAALSQGMGWSAADIDERFAAAAARIV